jgi:hypothetical protein
LRAAVVLVAIDLAAEPVLLAIHLRLLAFGEMAIMILAVIADFVVQPADIQILQKLFIAVFLLLTV